MSVNIKEVHHVKPIRPTKHLPIILSNYDVIMHETYISLIYFFKNDNSKNEFMNAHKLRTSLEEVLSDYYPLAGRLKNEPVGGLSIVYSDQGIPYSVAENPNITIKQLEEKNWENSSIPDGLIPMFPVKSSHDAPLFAVRHTTLSDGSVALGVSILHSVADAQGSFDFMEAWGLKACQRPIIPPTLDRSLLKASGNPPTHEHPEYPVVKLPDLSSLPVTMPIIDQKIFYFSKENLKKLHDAYSDKNSDFWISTNDALVSHVWRLITRARGFPLDGHTSCKIACDGRKKINPPLPQKYFGNFTLRYVSEFQVSELINGPRSNVAASLRKELSKIDDALIRSTTDWIEQHPIKTEFRFMLIPSDFGVSTWSKFPLYDLDFGDGTPIKCRLEPRAFLDGIAVIIPSNDGGLEVYVTLKPEHMEKFMQDPEFKEFQ